MCHLRNFIPRITIIIIIIIIINYIYFWNTQVGLHVKQNIVTILYDSEVRVAHLELFILWTSPIFQLLNNTWNTTFCAERIGTRSQGRE